MFSFIKKCPDEIEELAELYLMARLPEPENNAFENHVLGCTACIGVLEETDAFLRAFRVAAVPEERRV